MSDIATPLSSRTIRLPWVRLNLSALTLERLALFAILLTSAALAAAALGSLRQVQKMLRLDVVLGAGQTRRSRPLGGSGLPIGAHIARSFHSAQVISGRSSNWTIATYALRSLSSPPLRPVARSWRCWLAPRKGSLPRDSPSTYRSGRYPI